tara:strand:- start:590 stop:2392 length:1803 start_codon:yes stop_codon:yes gene_type:complete
LNKRNTNPKNKKPSQKAFFGFSTILKWSLVSVIWLFFLLGGIFWFLALDLPSVEVVKGNASGPSAILLDSDGIEFARFGSQRGTPVKLKMLPKHLIHAIISTEDRRFFQHWGIDPIAITRAFVENLKAGRIVQGGSTITQQAAKNLFLTPHKSLKRKVQEVILAAWLEKSLTKSQILSVYLNRVYFGAGAYGIDAAARRYFGINSEKLTIIQAATLAGLLKAPSRLNPLNNPGAAKRRAHQVLKNMVSAGYITRELEKKVKKQSLHLVGVRPQGYFARYFADWIIERLPDFIGPTSGTIIVKTTLDSNIQKISQNSLREALDKYGKYKRISDGATVVLDFNGAIRSLVGGKRYSSSQFNRATQAKRQPGSAFKPFVYLAGLEKGLSPTTIFYDKPIKIGKWAPTNYGGKYVGPLTMRDAFAISSNSVAVQIAQYSGIKNIVSVAKRLGISSPIADDLSISLGSSEVSLLELASAYVPFANGGKGVWAFGIEKIYDGKGKTLYKKSGSGSGRVISADNLLSLDTMLSDVLTMGTGKKARIDRKAGGKTGTSQKFRDAWFVGYDKNMLTGVWLGNDDGRPMLSVSGGSIPASIWKSIMLQIN